jgi:predicted ATPase
MQPLRRVEVENFLSLRQAQVDLTALNVLVGPNGAGKTNFLQVFQFLGDTVREDLQPAIARRGGYQRLRFRGTPSADRRETRTRLKVVGGFTSHSSATAPDEYSLTFRAAPFTGKVLEVFGQGESLARWEEFTFKRTPGKGRRITVEDSHYEIHYAGRGPERQRLAPASSALSTLPRLLDKAQGGQIQELAEIFESFRVFEVDVAAARKPSAIANADRLRRDASNLSSFLSYLEHEHPDIFSRLEADLCRLVPGLRKVRLRPVGGATEARVLELEEAGLKGATDLAEASFGTVRALALLALLHDPNPPRLTCVEEIDHGLHPHVLDLVVERLREASQRTQLLVVTHSPALVNRLDASELIVCERDLETGASRIPAIDSATVRRMEEAAGDLRLGELWFSGALGGGVA